MDREDKRRYLVVGSVILEIVSPLLRKRLEDCYKSKDFGCLQDFVNSLPVKHILFHLRHKNSKCCVDKDNCLDQQSLPLNYSQWNRMYTARSKNHNCHCKYTAKSIILNDLDLTLLSLILLNCCSLSSDEETLISDLRQFKNNYLSHNTDGAISETEYSTLWTDLTSYVLQLDRSKQNDLVIIQNRPLDESLCQYYVTCLLDVHVILERIETKIDATSAEIRTTIGNGITEVMDIIGTKTAELLASMGISNVGLMAKLEEVLQNKICQRCERNINDQDDQVVPLEPYKFIQSISALHYQTDLTLIVGDDWSGLVTDMAMMDDGRLVICLPRQSRLLILNIDGSQVDSIDVNEPWCVTALNRSTVAVIEYHTYCLMIYDINSKLKIKSIPPNRKQMCSGITTIKNKLVVSDDLRLLVIDHQTGEVEQIIQTPCYPERLHGSGGIIFYCDRKRTNLHWYRYSDGRHHTLTLPSPPQSMTTLEDGSLYVLCTYEAVHVSHDGKQYMTVKKKVFDKLNHPWISYNSKERKIVTISIPT